MRVVIVGPGRIGCGYLAPLFRSSGWEVVLGTRTAETAERIRQSRGFRVRITGENECLDVGGVDAATLGSPQFGDAVAGADLVCTSVGVSNVASLAEPLARALAARKPDRPLDVWVAENGDCAAGLERGVRACGLPLPPVGFAGAVASVAVAHGSWRTAGRCPEFVGDAFRSLFVDERRLLTKVPSLPGVSGTSHYLARLHEKLYVFNAGHAICAYLGWLRRHTTIAEAAADPSLRPLIAGSMLEARRALLAVHPSLGSGLHGPVAEALARFGDRELADPIPRVAREPIRKLAPGDRLLGPAELIRRRTRRVPEYFALAVAGAFLYRNEEEEQSRRLEAALARAGVMAVLERVCGLAPEHPFAKAVAARYRGFIITATETIFPPVHAVPAEAPRLPALAAGLASALGSR